MCVFVCALTRAHVCPCLSMTDRKKKELWVLEDSGKLTKKKQERMY